MTNGRRASCQKRGDSTSTPPSAQLHELLLRADQPVSQECFEPEQERHLKFNPPPSLLELAECVGLPTNLKIVGNIA